MPRRAAAVRREVGRLTPSTTNRLVTQLINSVLSTARKQPQSIVYGAFDIVAEKTGEISLSSRRLWIMISAQHLSKLCVLVALLTRSQWRSTRRNTLAIR